MVGSVLKSWLEHEKCMTVSAALALPSLQLSPEPSEGIRLLEVKKRLLLMLVALD